MEDQHPPRHQGQRRWAHSAALLYGTRPERAHGKGQGAAHPTDGPARWATTAQGGRIGTARRGQWRPMKSYERLARQQHLTDGYLKHGAEPLDRRGPPRRRHNHVAPDPLRNWVATTALQETKPPIQTFVDMDGQIMRNGTGCVLGVSKFSVPGMAMQLEDMIS